MRHNKKDNANAIRVYTTEKTDHSSSNVYQIFMERNIFGRRRDRTTHRHRHEMSMERPIAATVTTGDNAFQQR